MRSPVCFWLKRPRARLTLRAVVLSGLLVLQAQSTGFARAIPEQVAAAELPALPAEQNRQPRRHPPPEPAALDAVSKVRFEDRHERTIPGSIRTLRKVQRMMAAHPEVTLLRVEGHADDSGDPCFNLEVSKRRVRGVVRWLIANGVAAERLELVACGQRYAERTARSQATRAKNRRVELSVRAPTQGLSMRDRCDPIELK